MILLSGAMPMCLLDCIKLKYQKRVIVVHLEDQNILVVLLLWLSQTFVIHIFLTFPQIIFSYFSILLRSVNHRGAFVLGNWS